jgi:hypothetical protein
MEAHCEHSLQSAARPAGAGHPAQGRVLRYARTPTQELVDQIATYEAEDGVTARDILVIRRQGTPGMRLKLYHETELIPARSGL